MLLMSPYMTSREVVSRTVFLFFSTALIATSSSSYLAASISSWVIFSNNWNNVNHYQHISRVSSTITTTLHALIFCQTAMTAITVTKITKSRIINFSFSKRNLSSFFLLLLLGQIPMEPNLFSPSIRSRSESSFLSRSSPLLPLFSAPVTIVRSCVGELWPGEGPGGPWWRPK